MSQIKVEYNGTEIKYNEANDRWEFTLRNRDRYAETLSKAREAIDRPPPVKSKPFERIECWTQTYNGWEKVTVTSVAEKGWGDNSYLWVVDSRTNRSKQRNTALYPCNPANDQTVSQVIELLKEAKKLRDQIDDLNKGLTHLVVPPED